jgi:hypothetical protein
MDSTQQNKNDQIKDINEITENAETMEINENIIENEIKEYIKNPEDTDEGDVQRNIQKNENVEENSDENFEEPNMSEEISGKIYESFVISQDIVRDYNNEELNENNLNKEENLPREDVHDDITLSSGHENVNENQTEITNTEEVNEIVQTSPIEVKSDEIIGTQKVEDLIEIHNPISNNSNVFDDGSDVLKDAQDLNQEDKQVTNEDKNEFVEDLTEKRLDEQKVDIEIPVENILIKSDVVDQTPVVSNENIDVGPEVKIEDATEEKTVEEIKVENNQNEQTEEVQPIVEEINIDKIEKVSEEKVNEKFPHSTEDVLAKETEVEQNKEVETQIKQEVPSNETCNVNNTENANNLIENSEPAKTQPSNEEEIKQEIISNEKEPITTENEKKSNNISYEKTFNELFENIQKLKKEGNSNINSLSKKAEECYRQAIEEFETVRQTLNDKTLRNPEDIASWNKILVEIKLVFSNLALFFERSKLYQEAINTDFRVKLYIIF